MPKIVELTVEINVEKVSCPGVWLCQYGRVSLTVFTLGTGYQTCFLPPVFPLLFKDVFYFQKKYPAACTINNISCLLKNESIFCELVQWSDSCRTDDSVVLAQYMGSLTDVLFPPNVCSLEGVDLLMRRTEVFPGILAPKIEISTKIRIDEVFQPDRKIIDDYKTTQNTTMVHTKQYPVCHSVNFHKNADRRRSRSHSSRSCFSDNTQQKITNDEGSSKNYHRPACAEQKQLQNKLTLESRFIESDTAFEEALTDKIREKAWYKVRPCTCDICKRYHNLFHKNDRS